MEINKTILLLVSVVLFESCFVHPSCYDNADCDPKAYCDLPIGKSEGTCIDKCADDSQCADNEICNNMGVCIVADCKQKKDCPEGFDCIKNECRALDTLLCPEDMVVVENSFCIDIYEASRPDATQSASGTDGTQAMSRAGVIPWKVADNNTAQAACEASGKSLCTEQQWYRACSGPSETDYAYGNEYNAAICNGIDTFCYCESNSCSESVGESTQCPFASCYTECGGANFNLYPTGSFPGCTNAFGVYDMNGNLWEHVKNGSDNTIRGGAYNCRDSVKLHRCSYVPGTWTPSARGFRCCSTGTLGSALPDTDNDTDSGTENDGELGK